MKAWMGQQSAKILASAFGALAPGLIAWLLAKIEPEKIAIKVRPHMVAVMNSLPPSLQGAYVEALQKLVDIAAACIPKRTGGVKK